MLARVENGRAKTLAENSPVNIAALVDFVEYTLDDIKGTFLEDETMSVIIRYLSRGYIREVVIDIGRSALSSN